MKVKKTVRKRFKAWTKKEQNIMFKYYPKEGGAVINRLPNKNRDQVFHFACANGIKRVGGYNKTPHAKRIWTIAEVETMVSMANNGDTYRKIAEVIGNTTSSSVGKFLRSLGFHKRKVNAYTEEEKAIISHFVPREGVLATAERLPARTANQIYVYAFYHGIQNTVTLPHSQVTQNELDAIEEYSFSQGKDITFVADVIGKSETTVRKYIKAIEAEREMEEKKGSTWSVSETQILVANATCSEEELSKILLRTPKAIQSKKYRIGLK